MNNSENEFLNVLMNLILERLLEDEEDYLDEYYEDEYDIDDFIYNLILGVDDTPKEGEVLYLSEDEIEDIFKKKPEEEEDSEQSTNKTFDSVEDLMEYFESINIDDEEFTFEVKNEIDDKSKQKKKTKEYSKSAVKHPDHYNQTFLETMEKFLLIYSHKPDYIKGAMLFNIIKYTDRAGHKDNKQQDEEKAKFYLDVLKKLFPEDAVFYEKYRSNKK